MDRSLPRKQVRCNSLASSNLAPSAFDTKLSFEHAVSTDMRDKEKQKVRQHESYLRNKELTRERTRAFREKLKEMVREVKSQPCADCRESYPYYVMDFDHRDSEDKYDIISRLASRGFRSKLIEEMSKCDVVCANCHRQRTHERGYQGSLAESGLLHSS